MIARGLGLVRHKGLSYLAQQFYRSTTYTYHCRRPFLDFDRVRSLVTMSDAQDCQPIAKRVRRDTEAATTTTTTATAAETTTTSSATPKSSTTSANKTADSNYTPTSPESLHETLGNPIHPNPLQLTVDGTDGRARACTIQLPHGPVHTPVFMPVGTKGTIKCLTSEQVEQDPLNCEIILGNTYHLGNYPGPEVLRKLGGLHKLMNWKRNLLTDSGGFQMVSLFELSEVTEEGVSFKSPVDGSLMMLSPEKSMDIQNAIGADIMMMLDDVVSSKRIDYERVRW